MRYVKARISQKQSELAYRIYITDALKTIAENTGRGVVDGQWLAERWYDITREKPEETRTAKQIIDHVSAKITAIGGE